MIAAQFRSDAAWKAARAKQVWARRIFKKYGITAGQYAVMLRQQGGVCKLCGRPPQTIRLAIDHDHATHRVRGLLCFRCNKYWVAKNTKGSALKVFRYLASNFDGRDL